MRRKNVLVLHTDQQRYDSLGCTGNRFARTPHLDALAGEGTVFDRHVTSNTICMPSRASLLTGLYPPGHNVWTNGVPLNRAEYLAPTREAGPFGLIPQPTTLADAFAAAGYDTASFGKLHLTPFLASAEHGFPESTSTWLTGALDNWHGPYFGFQHVEMALGHGEGTCRVGHYASWLRGAHPELHARVLAAKKLPPRLPMLTDIRPSVLPYAQHPTNWLAERFCGWLEGRDRETPFFAFVGWPDPHHPFMPAADVAGDFEGMEVEEPVDFDGSAWADSPVPTISQCAIPQMSAEDRRVVRRYTHAMIHQIDRAVGRVLQAVRDHGLWEDTIIVFTSDHGDFLGDHNLLRKGWAGCDALLHVPFLLRAPGVTLPKRVGRVMSNCDVFPTLAALAGVPAPEGLHGRDILGVLRSGEPHCAFACNADGDPRNTNYDVYDDRYRLSFYPGRGLVTLYDHSSDPAECHNVADGTENRETVQRMLDTLARRLLADYNPILSRFSRW